ncbi:metallophosphoesterase [Aerosakkonemataceae cyanobacterium BLCC-F50]|uniref:Metallophosphoesterase n=1 Tax=Floridaenema flaviceps BLCC-F50 TaxID=3153642 RepID=A0ABV4XN22_9CYAN
MKIICYSDLHFEFGWIFRPPADSDADLMILAGDIITCKDYTPLSRFLQNWQKLVLYVMGNHEYYTRRPMPEEERKFRQWLSERHPNVTLLLDEAIAVDGVHFFGGTMWTDFDCGNSQAMRTAQQQMNDYYKIYQPDGQPLTPAQTIVLHEIYKEKLIAWFENDLSGARVVISHHAPVMNPNTQYKDSPFWPAFHSLDMLPLIESYQPALWVYGHTHECDDQTIGKTRVISNQSGYPNHLTIFECPDFDLKGQAIEVT